MGGRRQGSGAGGWAAGSGSWQGAAIPIGPTVVVCPGSTAIEVRAYTCRRSVDRFERARSDGRS
eukprot:382321-Prymnesium_polylepis.1